MVTYTHFQVPIKNNTCIQQEVLCKCGLTEEQSAKEYNLAFAPA